MRAVLVAILCGLALPIALAQTADGTYPATLACDAGSGAGALRAAGTVIVSAGRATYEFRIGSGREAGAGALAGRRLTLSGNGRGGGRRVPGELCGARSPDAAAS
jgi:hypothetical protein